MDAISKTYGLNSACWISGTLYEVAAMHYYKIELDKTEMDDQHSCRDLLPIDGAKISSTDVIKCSASEYVCGFCIMRDIPDSDVDVTATVYTVEV